MSILESVRVNAPGKHSGSMVDEEDGVTSLSGIYFEALATLFADKSLVLACKLAIMNSAVNNDPKRTEDNNSRAI